MRHALSVCVPEPRETEKGLDHVHEPLAGCDLHPYTHVAVARIPPGVPADAVQGLKPSSFAGTVAAQPSVILFK